ncbi:unnamed protein product [Effrenium voratum]|uniref:NADPH-dependent diflavin oxidoreductase 1 n=1 Tax=Effrenium voratum TaxID=2562239 RepID=A0AA36IXB2_9DINO|nr:unnamed protein product [Effrenium voratum]
MAPMAHVELLFASQTGTAEETAWELAREGRRKGFLMEPCALDDLRLEELCKVRLAVFVVSTTGQGDPPMNMRRLWQELLCATLPATLLQGLSFTVFGLGDTRYREFNYAARKLFVRLQGLGATAFWRLGLGDDQHDFGMEQELDPWSEGMWAALAEKLPPAAESDAEVRYEVEEMEQSTNGHTPPVELPEDSFWSELLAKRSLLSAEEEDVPDVWNFRLRLPPDQHYLAGDVLVVWPEMDSVLVRRFVVDTLERSLTDCIRIRPKCSSSSSPFPSRALTLEEVFSRYVDVSAMPSRHFFHVLSQHTPDELHKKKLSEFASRTLEAKDALYEYCKRERRSAAEVMWDFWTARPPLAELLSALPLLRPRRYSIASSPKWAGPGRAVGAWSLTQRPFWMPLEVSPSRALPRMLADLWGEHGLSEDLDLCVGIVDSVTRSNRQVKGLCSNFLKNAAVGSRLRCSLERGTLQLPALEVPLIMVCPGTGLSPCRALVQARHRQVQSNPLQRPKDLMFLGFRHQRADFLYGEEWDTFEAWLSVQVAFSRDHEDKKVYVQDLIEEQGPHVRRLLDAGAVIFVCGRSHPMPSQVFDAFVEVLQHGGMTAEAATQRLRLMQRTQRYICDTWG